VQRTLLLHFLKFDIQSSEPDAGAWIDRLYADNDLRAYFPAHEATLRLSIERRDTALLPSDMPPPGAVFAETNLCGVPCFYADGRFYAARESELRLRLEFDLRTSTIRAQVGGAYLESGQHVVTDLIRPILQSFLLPFYRLKSLHGAVLHGRGRTIFLDGPGGAGKTTTAMSLAKAGYDVLSDDGPLFTVADDKTYVLSSLDFAHVTEQTLRLFPFLEPLLVGGKDRRGKYAVSLRPLQQRSSSQPLTITHYVRLQRGPVATPRLRPLDKNELFRHLIDSSMVVFRPAPFHEPGQSFKAYSQGILDLISHLVRDADVYDLEFADHHLPNIPALLESV
jgi:hypothetical protein